MNETTPAPLAYSSVYSVVYEKLDEEQHQESKEQQHHQPSPTFPLSSRNHDDDDDHHDDHHDHQEKPPPDNFVVLARRGCTKSFEAYRWHDRWRTIMFDMYQTHQRAESSSASKVQEDNVRLLSLRSLVRDFQEQAEKYGKIIIEERDVPSDYKTLKPSCLGGWAGGEKYLYAGILFKFADSVPLPTELANKISAIEFNATQSIHQALDRTKDEQEQLSVPLTTILDYLGYRLEAVAFSPISDDTLVYGSCDAGKHVRRIDPVTDALMAEYGDRLNLRPHLVKQRCDGTNVEVFGAADVEVHLVRDEDENNDDLEDIL